MRPNRRLRKLTVTLEEDVAQRAEIEAVRHNTSVSQLLVMLLKENISARSTHTREAAERLANFGRRHRLSLRGFKIKHLTHSAV
jgi:uncharacterized protein DUF6364